MATKQVVTNTAVQFFGKIVGAASGFFTTLLLARQLGAAYYGEYTKIAAFTVLFYLLVDFGLNAGFLRQHKTLPQIHKELGYFFGLRLFLGFGFAAVAFLSAMVISLFNPGFTPLVRFGVLSAAPAIIGYAVLLTGTVYAQAQLRFDKPVFAQICGSIASILLIGFFLGSTSLNQYQGVLVAAGVLSISSLISAITVWWMVTSELPTLPQVDFKRWKYWWRLSLPLGLVLLFNVVYFRVDLFLLSYYRSASEIGAYGYAYKFFEFAITIPTFLMNSLYPVLLMYYNSASKFWRLVKQMMLGLFILSLIIGGLFYLLAPLIVLRSDFTNSVVLLRLLSLSLPIFYLTSPLMWLFVLIKKQQHLIAVYGLALLFNTVCNFIFIPHFGAIAAAVLTGISEIGVLLIGTIILWFDIKKGIAYGN